MRQDAEINVNHGQFVYDESSSPLPSAAAEIVDSRIYDADIPDFAGSELDRLYGSLYSSLSHFRINGGLEDASTYISERNGKPAVILLFRIERRNARVINEGMRLRAEDVERFCVNLFQRYPLVTSVTFHAVRIVNTERRISCVQQRFFCAEDFVADLPDSAEAYLAMLGNATRKNLKRHRNRLERAFPDFSFRVDEKDAIREDDVRRIIAFNRVRMAQKQKASFIDEEETQRILQLVKTCGTVSIVTIGGELAAGAIAVRIGDSVISKVNAHDSRYDDYRLGMLCCYLTVCAAIEAGARRFHFGHGRYDYKTALLGAHETYDHLVLYRSRLQQLRDGRRALGIALSGYRVEGSRWLLDKIERDSGAGWNVMRKALAAWRARKQRGATAT
ncbi:GNAT family N-acetyltransferase [Noviherbaspirillum sp. Root189]|uniref:GNAT family N-acetyltransferase n=1 Tax=Noviherbaspirillum sp. Root189 TaxID=1736487 RepID=UPI00070A2087|nr:GNAT family N-acetyltransferase [Noviherbaspirillum sp. Root189]KRB93068.1 hypothetical protein ASE07_13915 [Noviherbaspirillum sp. Root189]